MEEKSPKAEWNWVSAVVLDMIETTEKFFYILGPLMLAIDLVAATASSFYSVVLGAVSGPLPESWLARAPSVSYSNCYSGGRLGSGILS
jgi:hypothetical protein